MNSLMMKRLVIAAAIFGIASLAGLSIGVRSPFAVDNAVMEGNDRVVLNGTVHPNAGPEFDVGPTDPSLPMNRTILLLKIAPEKQAELDRLVAEQQDPSSPTFTAGSLRRNSARGSDELPKRSPL